MNEVDAIRLKLSKAKNIYDVIECCYMWRKVMFNKVKKDLRSYQTPLSNIMIEYVLTKGLLGNEVITLWARQSGKTETVTLTALTLGTFYIMFLNEEFNCGLFAPVESMITHVTRNRLRKRYKNLRKFLLGYNIKQTAGQGHTSSLFILENMLTENEFVCRSLSVGEHASIIGETFKLLVIEQSELVNSMKMKNDVFPMGAEEGGVRVLTGTTSPYFKNEYFRDAVQKWNDDPTKNKSTADYVECIDWRRAAKDSRTYKRYVTKEMKRMKEDSLEFKTQFGLQWAGTKLKFIGWTKLADLEEDYVWSEDRLRFVGIDVAQSDDSTVVTIIELDGMHIHIIAWLELQGIDYEVQVREIARWLKQYKPIRFGLVDIVGMGKPVFDMLKKQLIEEDEDENLVYWCRLEGYYGSSRKNHLVNKAMERECQHGRLHFPEHTRYKREKNRFIDQILDLERKYTGAYLKLEHPNIKGRHDDYSKSLGYAVWALKKKSFRGGVVSVSY